VGDTPSVRAAVQYEYGAPLVVEELELDPPRAGEVLVRMAASGVCRSDWHEMRGIHRRPVPGVLGHEGSGVIEQVGEGVEGLEPGDHVVLSWLPYCGSCRRCASGRPNLCENLGVFDAGFLGDGTVRFHKGDLPIHSNVPSSLAERTVVPARTAIRVDPGLPLEQVALLGCAVMTGVGAVLNTARVRPGEAVVVIGCGGVGLSVIQGARIAGAWPIVAVDVVDSKLDLARRLGATETVLGTGEDPEAAIRDVLPGGADFSFEALGRVATIELATRATAPGGTAVLVGMASPDARAAIDALTLTVQERTITGCWYGSCVPPRDFPRMAELVRAGELRLDAMIGRTFDLDGINEALGLFEQAPEARSVILYGDPP